MKHKIDLVHHDGVERIIIDPGIGFGKTTEHNLELIRWLDEIVALGYPVLEGVSRKRFIGDITRAERPADRLAGTLTAHLGCLTDGARLVRARDVADHVIAIRMWQALQP